MQRAASPLRDMLQSKLFQIGPPWKYAPKLDLRSACQCLCPSIDHDDVYVDVCPLDDHLDGSGRSRRRRRILQARSVLMKSYACCSLSTSWLGRSAQPLTLAGSHWPPIVPSVLSLPTRSLCWAAAELVCSSTMREARRIVILPATVASQPYVLGVELLPRYSRPVLLHLWLMRRMYACQGLYCSALPSFVLLICLVFGVESSPGADCASPVL